MPIHDWSQAPAGYFHHFHQTWSVEICNELNRGILPAGFFALVEQREAGGAVPDVLTLHGPAEPNDPAERGGGVALLKAPPRTRFVSRSGEQAMYATRANQVVVRAAGGEVVSVIEIVSPGNKSSRAAIRSFVEKSVDFLNRGIHLLVIDLLPPTQRDPQGIHKAIWDEVQEEPFVLPSDKPLTLASYCAGPIKTAYVEPVAVGDALPGMPAFLSTEMYVAAPLDLTYQMAWNACPSEFKAAVQGLKPPAPADPRGACG